LNQQQRVDKNKYFKIKKIFQN